MSSDFVEFKILDLHTFSGSADRLRTQVGGYYSYYSASDGEGYTFVGAPTSDYPGAYGSSFINNVYTNLTLRTTGATSAQSPSYVVPVRIVGNSADSGYDDYFRDSKHWETFLRGGVYNTASYSRVFTRGPYSAFQMRLEAPYGQAEANMLSYAENTPRDTAAISYEYNHSYPAYENYVNTIPELLIPNMYHLCTAWNHSYDSTTAEDLESNALIDEALKNYLSREGFVENEELMDLLTPQWSDTKMAPPSSVEESTMGDGTAGWYDSNLKLRAYLTGAVVNNPLSSSTRAMMLNLNQNLYFDNDFYSGVNLKIEEAKSRFPYYTTVTIPNVSNYGPATSFREIVEEQGYSQKLLQSLHETFGGRGHPAYRPRRPEPYSWNLLYNSASLTQTISTVGWTSDTSTHATDFIRLLLLNYNIPSPLGTAGRSMFVGRKNLSRMASTSDDIAYRPVNVVKTLKVLDHYINKLTSSIEAVPAWGNLQDIYNMAHHDADSPDDSTVDFSFTTTFHTTLPDGTSVETTAKSPNIFKDPEALAFSVEKSLNGTNLQTFWFYNKIKNDEGFNLYDTQVKYDRTYRYDMFAYVLKMGINYTYYDFKIAHAIASASIDDTTLYCLKFTDLDAGYDGEASNQLYYTPEDNSIIYTPEAYEIFESVGADPHTLNLLLTGSGAHLISTEPYIADFNFHYEISPRLFRIPVTSKSITITDSPVAALDIDPYQLLNNSNTLGFFLRKDASEALSSNYAPLFPTPIEARDETYMHNFLTSNNMFRSFSRINKKAISEISHIEVYRLTELPTQLSDFRQNLYATIELAIKSLGTYYPQEYYLSTFNFHDKVRSNQKYYYLFRGLDVHGHPGYSSAIYEAELVDDGGYKYATFETIYENELEVDPYTETAIPLKNLLKISPAPLQIELDASEADYDEDAYTQLDNISVGQSADDPIWGKTFKFRLTSKKTNKKIDLNITYELETE